MEDTVRKNNVNSYLSMSFVIVFTYYLTFYVLLQHVRVIRNDKLKIYAPEVDRSKLQYELHTIKCMLPKVIVKVSYT